jgi:hypothetical protein
VALVNRICNLERVEGLNCKDGGLRANLQIDFEICGPKRKICIRAWAVC